MTTDERASHGTDHPINGEAPLRSTAPGRPGPLGPAASHPAPTPVPAVGPATTGPAPTSVHELGVELAELSRKLTGPLQRLSVRSGDCEIAVEWTTSTTPATGQTAGVAAAPAQPPEEVADTGFVVRAPLVGTYYSAQAPEADPFVTVGDVVVLGQTLAIVEAMKMMNPVLADCEGTVAEILVSNGQPVEFEQPLLRLLPTEVPA